MEDNYQSLDSDVQEAYSSDDLVRKPLSLGMRTISGLLGIYLVARSVFAFAGEAQVPKKISMDDKPSHSIEQTISPEEAASYNSDKLYSLKDVPKYSIDATSGATDEEGNGSIGGKAVLMGDDDYCIVFGGLYRNQDGKGAGNLEIGYSRLLNDNLLDVDLAWIHNDGLNSLLAEIGFYDNKGGMSITVVKGLDDERDNTYKTLENSLSQTEVSKIGENDDYNFYEGKTTTIDNHLIRENWREARDGVRLGFTREVLEKIVADGGISGWTGRDEDVVGLDLSLMKFSKDDNISTGISGAYTSDGVWNVFVRATLYFGGDGKDVRNVPVIYNAKVLDLKHLPRNFLVGEYSKEGIETEVSTQTEEFRERKPRQEEPPPDNGGDEGDGGEPQPPVGNPDDGPPDQPFKQLELGFVKEIDDQAAVSYRQREFDFDKRIVEYTGPQHEQLELEFKKTV